MKKTKFYIAMCGKTPTAKQVDGYFLYIDGVAIGLHRWDKKSNWIVSELSTGFRIADAETRQKALEKVKPLLQKVKEKINTEKVKPIKEMIQAAYTA